MEKLKNIKNFKLKLVFSLVFLILMIVQIGPYLLLADENSKTFSYQYRGSYLTNAWYNGVNHTFSESYLDQDVAYCVDPLNAWPDNGSQLVYRRNLSSYSTALLLYGYPYSSPADLGVADKDEATMATQYALWSLVKSVPTAPDSQKTSVIFDLDNVEAKPGYEEKVARIIAASRRLVNRAINAPYYANPALDVDKSGSQVVLKDDYILVGPYNVNASGFDISSINVSISESTVSSVLADAQGNEKSTFQNGEGVYVKLPKNGNATNITLNINAKGSYVIGKVYGTGVENDGRQDYATLVNEPVDLTTNIHISTPDLIGNIKVQKVDNKENPLQGVSFELTDSEGNVIDTKLTDENGNVEFTGLKIGNYYVREVNGLEGYIWEKEAQAVPVNYNKTTTIKFVNIKIEGGLKIIKIDEDGNPLKGVEFELLDSAKNRVGEPVVTNSEGIAYFPNLALGTYYVKEVSAPDNIVKDTKEREIKISKLNETIEFTLRNYYVRGKLTIIKVDENKNRIEGVKFNILNENNQIAATVVTDANGEATTGYLKNGKYFVQEVSVPNNKYVLNTERQEVTMAYKDQSIEIENKLSKGKLKIIKTDEIGNRLKDVTFEIRRFDDDELVDTIVTNENGEAISKELEVGSYYYKEVSAPNYVEMDTNPYEFDITENGQIITKEIKNKCKAAPIVIEKFDEDGVRLPNVKFILYQIVDGKEVVIEKLVTGEDGTATSKYLLPGIYYLKETDAPANVVVSEEVIKIEHSFEGTVKQIVNNFARGTLKIVKTDENASPVKDVVFEVKDLEGNVVDTITTNEEGIAVSKKLKLGKYTYQEVKAPEYVVMDTKSYEFELKENNQVIEKSITNELVKGSLTILKVDEDKKPIANVTFKIFDANKKEIAKATTGKDGIVKFEKLSVGVKYYYQEVDAPIKYAQDNELKEFTLELKEKDITVTFENKLYTKPVTFKKVDNDGNAIANVTFNIYAADKKTLVAEGLKTDENGYVTSEPLPLGKYYYQETSAPDIYIVNDDLIQFAITKTNEDLVIEVVNYKLTGKLIITKIDKDTKQVLSGVTFEVYDENGNLLKELVTDENGIASISDLYKGKYYFKETKTLDNYILDDSTYEFNITKDGQEAKATITNEAKKLPQTGGFLSTDALIVIVVAVVSIAGYIVISLVVKNKKSEE